MNDILCKILLYEVVMKQYFKPFNLFILPPPIPNPQPQPQPEPEPDPEPVPEERFSWTEPAKMLGY